MKRIAGLPRIAKLDLSRLHKVGGSLARLKAKGLALKYRNNRLMEVLNSEGSLQPVWIVQTGRPGFTVTALKPPYKELGYGYRNAESLAVQLALKGHRRVVIDD